MSNRDPLHLRLGRTGKVACAVITSLAVAAASAGTAGAAVKKVKPRAVRGDVIVFKLPRVKPEHVTRDRKSVV